MTIIASILFEDTDLVISNSLDKFGYYKNVREYEYKNLLQLFPLELMGEETHPEISLYLQVIRSKLGSLVIYE